MIELMIKDIEYFRTKNDSTVVNILKTSLLAYLKSRLDLI